MTRQYGVCPKCFAADIEALDRVLRRCRCCGKHFGQPDRSLRRALSKHASRLVPAPAHLRVAEGG